MRTILTPMPPPPARTNIPMTYSNGQVNGLSNGKYPRQQVIPVPTLPHVSHQPSPMNHPPPPMPPPVAAAAAPYPGPSHHGYPQQAPYAPTPQTDPFFLGEQSPAYNPHHQPAMEYNQQHFSPQQQYHPQAFGNRPISQPPPYEVQAPPLLDKGMAFPPPAMGGPSAPPPGDPEYPRKY